MPPVATPLQYEIIADTLTQGEYRVEAIDTDGDGEVYVAIFSGPDAEQRASEYGRWKNSI